MRFYYIGIIFIGYVSCNLCEGFGSTTLGHNIVLLEGDRLEDRVIVLCSARSSSFCCTGGEIIVPNGYELHMKSGNYQEYVIEAKFNDDWVIAVTKHIQYSSKRYWVVDKRPIKHLDCSLQSCDSIIRKEIKGPFSEESFKIEVIKSKIQLTFKN